MIVIDSGEKAYVRAAFDKQKIPYVVEQITFHGDVYNPNKRVADFTNTERAFIIERKSAHNLVSTILNQEEYTTQNLKMATLFDGPRYLIVEGDIWAEFMANADKLAFLESRYLRYATSYGINIIMSANVEQTARFVKDIDRTQGLPPPDVHVNKVKTSDPRLTLLQAFPKVGPQIAANLLNAFKSVKNIINATEKELKTVDKVGPKIAKRIVLISGATSAREIEKGYD